MKQTWLKKIRVVIALVFFALTTWLFIDFEKIEATPAATVALYPQFIPSLLKFTQTFAWIATGFLVVLILTLLFGRIYCSMICPLGTLQDILIRMADVIRKPRRVKFRYQKPMNGLRYGLLAFSVLLFLSGSMIALSLLDPFSNFGRIASDLIRPLYVAAYNGIGQLLEQMGLNSPVPLQWKAPAIATLLFPTLFLVGLAGLTVVKGRAFCNWFCPVGALLGLIARVALFKIRIPKDACILCTQCSVHCKAGCIRLKTKEVDFSRCVACFNCITVCEAHGIGYAKTQPRRFHVAHTPASPPALLAGEATPSPPQVAGLKKERAAGVPVRDAHDPARRMLLHQAGLLLVSWAGLAPQTAQAAKPHNRLPTTLVNPKRWPVAPPGAGSVARFNELCSACHLCISACAYGVLQPALLQYGWSGLLQPRMDYAAGYCSYECHRCGQICPTGAIQPLDLATKQITQLGKAHFIRDNCIVHTDRMACGVCADYCPTKAVHLMAYQDQLLIPTVQEALCIGCGSCENACPARPHRAIYVDGHPVQQWAERPRVPAGT